MIDILSKDGQKLLEAVCYSKAIFAFDFDGTLCGIVKDPARANMSAKTLSLLRGIGKYAPTAVISGRALEDLHNKIAAFDGLLVGNHGLEGIHSARKKLPKFRDACAVWRKALEGELLGRRSLDGIEIEDKAFSLAVHYRKSRSKKTAKSAIMSAIGRLNPSARIILGKCVINVVPIGAPHKGVALLELMLKTGTRSAFYIGDDDTDEDVFALPDPRIFTVRVGKKSGSRAKFYLKRQADMNTLMEKILNFMRS